MPYRYLDDVATADIAFESWDDTLDGTFHAAAEATMGVMVEDLDSVRPSEEREIELEDEALDMLLFETLQEIISLKDSEGLLLRFEDVRIERSDSGWSLRARGVGEEVDPDRHETGVDVKAVTLHRLAIEPSDGGWQASVLLDV